MVKRETPPLKIAKRFVDKFQLKPPYDLLKLVEQFAIVIHKEIPYDNVDGVTLHLKAINKPPKVIVNSKQSERRRNFTIAHELGHIIIPWHVGTIIDDTNNREYNNSLYLDQEREANTFAAEILMPTNWILELISTSQKFAKIHETIINSANVSPLASAIKLIKILPKNSVYVGVKDGKVITTGFSCETNSLTQNLQDDFQPQFYKHVEEYSTCKFGQNTFHWYKLQDHIKLISAETSEDWDKILREILLDIYDQDEIEIKRKSILSMISYAHSRLNFKTHYTIDELITDSVKRLRRPELFDFVEHKRFEDFLKSRCEFLIRKKKKKS